MALTLPFSRSFPAPLFLSTVGRAGLVLTNGVLADLPRPAPRKMRGTWNRAASAQASLTEIRGPPTNVGPKLFFGMLLCFCDFVQVQIIEAIFNTKESEISGR